MHLIWKTSSDVARCEADFPAQWEQDEATSDTHIETEKKEVTNSLSLMTLKLGQGHWKWCEFVKLDRDYHHEATTEPA